MPAARPPVIDDSGTDNKERPALVVSCAPGISTCVPPLVEHAVAACVSNRTVLTLADVVAVTVPERATPTMDTVADGVAARIEVAKDETDAEIGGREREREERKRERGQRKGEEGREKKRRSNSPTIT